MEPPHRRCRGAAATACLGLVTLAATAAQAQDSLPRRDSVVVLPPIEVTG